MGSNTRRTVTVVDGCCRSQYHPNDRFLRITVVDCRTLRGAPLTSNYKIRAKLDRKEYRTSGKKIDDSLYRPVYSIVWLVRCGEDGNILVLTTQ